MDTTLQRKPTSDFGLPKDKRIRRRKEYLRIGRIGQRFHSTNIAFVVKRSPRGSEGRFGFTASKQVGPAHERNLAKRRLKHLARTNQKALRAFDIVIIVKAGAQHVSFVRLNEEFSALSAKVTRFFANASPHATIRTPQVVK